MNKLIAAIAMILSIAITQTDAHQLIGGRGSVGGSYVYRGGGNAYRNYHRDGHYIGPGIGLGIIGGAVIGSYFLFNNQECYYAYTGYYDAYGIPLTEMVCN